MAKSSGRNTAPTDKYSGPWRRKRPERYEPPTKLPEVDVHGILFALVAVVFVVYPLEFVLQASRRVHGAHTRPAGASRHWRDFATSFQVFLVAEAMFKRRGSFFFVLRPVWLASCKTLASPGRLRRAGPRRNTGPARKHESNSVGSARTSRLQHALRRLLALRATPTPRAG